LSDRYSHYCVLTSEGEQPLNRKDLAEDDSISRSGDCAIELGQPRPTHR